MTSEIRKVVNIIKKEEERGGKVLVVVPKQVRDHLEKWGGNQHRRRSGTRQGATLAHYNNIRGSDHWAGYDTVIIVGREEPSPIVIDRLARAIWADDSEPLQFGGGQKYPVEPRGYRLRDGSHKGVMTPLHPDPRAQRRLELIREKEMVQAIDRLRLVHATRAKRVIILCSIPLDITVDELRTLDDLAGNPEPPGWRGRLELAFEKLGLLPLGKRDLHGTFPDLFPSEARASDALKEARKEIRKHAAENGGRHQIKYLFGHHPHLRIATYRRAGQRGRASSVLYDPDRCRNPREILSILLKEVLVEFEDAPDDEFDA